MPDEGTILLYALSTLAQTCAALAAFVGAVGLVRIGIVREGRRAAAIRLRGAAANAGIITRDEEQYPVPDSEVVKRVEQATPPKEDPHNHFRKAGEELVSLRRARRRFYGDYILLGIFEGWNLLVIGAALVGFNYVPELVDCEWTFDALWPVAIITVGVTVVSVLAWTRE